VTAPALAPAPAALGDGRVCLAVRPDLAPVVRDAIRAARPRATVLDLAHCEPGAADVLVVAPHELPEDEVRRLVRMQTWRWIHLTSAGYDFFRVEDVPPETVLTRSASCYAPPLSEYVAMALLEAARPGPRPWERGHVPAADVGLFGQLLGVAGFGAVGRSVAALGGLLGMRVRVLTRRPRDPGELPQGVEGTTSALDLRDVDHLVVALGLNEETRDLFDAEFFAACKPGLHLVNVSRGELVDHAALGRAVAERGVRATLDVTDPEPLPADHPLRSEPGVRISPHVAWHSRTSDWSFVRDFLDNWSRWEEGAQLGGVIALKKRGSVR
jgi:phosphoglycerate dehydrogenase-like enzyme